MAERRLCKAEVRGSIPLVSTDFWRRAVSNGARPASPVAFRTEPGVNVPRQNLLRTAIRTAVPLVSLCMLAACGASDGTGGAAGAAAIGDQASQGSAAGSNPASAQPTLPKATDARTPTAAPTPVDGPCPYLTTDVAMNTVGQHLTRTTVTATKPHPSCAFYRPDGGLAIQITVSQEANPIAAQNGAVTRVGKDANPVNGIGDYGVVAIVDDGALLAVTQGPTLVLVKINQKSSLEAKEIATSVIEAL